MKSETIVYLLLEHKMYSSFGFNMATLSEQLQTNVKL